MYEILLNDKLLIFETQEDVFYPTGTSLLLLEASKKAISSPKKILDLGCGCGFAGLTLAKLGLCAGPLYASDISSNAVKLAKINAERMSVAYQVRCGSLFEPWQEERFEVIINDIAGISDCIAEISAWYPAGVSCNAGRDGTRWIGQVIRQSRRYLTEKGMLIFPALSLSDEKIILGALKENYSSYELLLEKEWFLPDEIASRSELLMSLLNDGAISCQKKFGKWIWSTRIYRANN